MPACAPVLHVQGRAGEWSSSASCAALVAFAANAVVTLVLRSRGLLPTSLRALGVCSLAPSTCSETGLPSQLSVYLAHTLSPHSATASQLQTHHPFWQRKPGGCFSPGASPKSASVGLSTSSAKQTTEVTSLSALTQHSSLSVSTLPSRPCQPASAAVLVWKDVLVQPPTSIGVEHSSSVAERLSAVRGYQLV